jgi:predicted amidohydrolase YtcJ
MAIRDGSIVGVGNNLQYDPEFIGFSRIDAARRVIIPGLVDAHTHIALYALSLGRVKLDGVTSLEACLKKIKTYAERQNKAAWVVGEGYSSDRFVPHDEPNRHALDRVTGGRPAFIFSKDTHTAWVNSAALKRARISAVTPDPESGKIERFEDGTPTGILREQKAYMPVWNLIKPPPASERKRLWSRTLDHAYRQGVTGVHSFDSWDGFEWLAGLDRSNKLGFRINYYAPVSNLDDLISRKMRYGQGSEFLRLAGVKIFADGALGSQTALCYKRYHGSNDNYGIEVTPAKEITKMAKKAAHLGLPCAIHAIGDKAVANVLDALEDAPRANAGVRHRIEHLQLLRRKDIARVKRLGVVASMQPSHCPSDIDLVRKYWGARGRNAYVFRTLIERGVDIAFGSDAPIEPLDPISGIAAAVRRARPGSRDVFLPEERISAEAALYRFTVGPAIAAGQDGSRGRLLPGYPADFVVLDRNITRIAPLRITDTKVLATVIGGTIVYARRKLDW